MKNSNKLLLFVLFFGDVVIAQVVIDDPVKDFLTYEIETGGLFKENSIIKITADLNEDGIDDIFISTTAEDRIAGKTSRSWDGYLSTPDKKYVLARDSDSDQDIRASFVLDSSPTLVSLAEVGNKKALVSYFPGGSSGGVMTATYASGGNGIGTYSFGSLEINGVGKDAEDVEIMNGTYQKGVAVPKTVEPLSTYMSASEISGLESWEETFRGKYNVVPDFDSPGHYLVLDKKTREIVGHKKRFGKFIPLVKEAKLEKYVEPSVQPIAAPKPEKNSAGADSMGVEAEESSDKPLLESPKTSESSFYWMAGLFILFFAVIFGFYVARRK